MNISIEIKNGELSVNDYIDIEETLDEMDKIRLVGKLIKMILDKTNKSFNLNASYSGLVTIGENRYGLTLNEGEFDLTDIKFSFYSLIDTILVDKIPENLIQATEECYLLVDDYFKGELCYKKGAD